MQHFVAVVLKLTTVCRINIRLIIHIYIQDFFTDYGRAKKFFILYLITTKFILKTRRHFIFVNLKKNIKMGNI